jgi:hypothetical protein
MGANPVPHAQKQKPIAEFNQAGNRFGRAFAYAGRIRFYFDFRPDDGCPSAEFRP